MLYRARDSMQLEMESPSFRNLYFDYKFVLRYVPAEKEWAVYRIFAETGRATFAYYFKNYEDALRTFNRMCEQQGLDTSEIKRIRMV